MRAADWGESPDPEPGAGVRERVPRPRRCMSPSHVSWSSTRSSTGTQRTRDSSTTRATRGNGPTGRTRPDLPSRPGNPGATPSPTNHEVGERRPLSPLPCGGPPPPHTDGAGRPSRACVRRPRTRVCLKIAVLDRPAFVPRTTGKRQEKTGTAGASNPQVRWQIRPSPQVARSAPRTLSRWRHGSGNYVRERRLARSLARDVGVRRRSRGELEVHR
jgi:hypothetical protein